MSCHDNGVSMFVARPRLLQAPSQRRGEGNKCEPAPRRRRPRNCLISQSLIRPRRVDLQKVLDLYDPAGVRRRRVRRSKPALSVLPPLCRRSGLTLYVAERDGDVLAASHCSSCTTRSPRNPFGRSSMTSSYLRRFRMRGIGKAKMQSRFRLCVQGLLQAMLSSNASGRQLTRFLRALGFERSRLQLSRVDLLLPLP